MSRQKNALEKGAGNADFIALIYGRASESWNQDVLGAVAGLTSAPSGGRLKRPDWTVFLKSGRRPMDRYVRRGILCLLSAVSDAMQTGEATRLRQIADGIENLQSKRGCPELFIESLKPLAKKGVLPITQTEFLNQYPTIDHKTAKQIVSRMGVIFSRGKRGPQPGAKRASGHRAGR